MRNIKSIFSILLSLILFAGCTSDLLVEQSSPETVEAETKSVSYAIIEHGGANDVVVDGHTFSVDYINTVLLEAINNGLYYSVQEGSLYLFNNPTLILGKQLEYDMYYVRSSRHFHEHMIYIIFPNEIYPSKDTGVYEFGYSISSKGMSHVSYSMGPVVYDDNYGKSTDTKSFQYLGKFSMVINTITKPEYDEISDIQCMAIDSGIKQWMESDGTYLEPGTYTVYVCGFYKADSNATIYFLHENGSLYSGFIWTLTGISEDGEPVTPYRIGKLEGSLDYQNEYIKLVKEQAVFQCSYEKKTPLNSLITGDSSAFSE